MLFHKHLLSGHVAYTHYASIKHSHDNVSVEIDQLLQNDCRCQDISLKYALIFRVNKSQEQQAEKKSSVLKQLIFLENSNHKKQNWKNLYKKKTTQPKNVTECGLLAEFKLWTHSTHRMRENHLWQLLDDIQGYNHFQEVYQKLTCTFDNLKLLQVLFFVVWSNFSKHHCFYSATLPNKYLTCHHQTSIVLKINPATQL